LNYLPIPSPHLALLTHPIVRGQGYEHWLIMADSPANCAGMHTQWDAMVATHGVAPLSCAYSSMPASHVGWAQWQLRGGDNYDKMYKFWSTRWWVCLALVRQKLNVLSLDVDAVLLTDIYQHLRSPPLVRSLYKMLFCVWAFVQESILFFAHSLCLGTSPSSLTLLRNMISPPTPRYCNIYHALLVMVVKANWCATLSVTNLNTIPLGFLNHINSRHLG